MTGSKPTNHQPVVMAACLTLGVLLIIGLALALPGQAMANLSFTSDQLQTDDDTCLGCHGQPDLRMDLPSGETLFVAIHPDVYATSVHAQAGIACVDCHRDITGYPHRVLPANNLREVTIYQSQFCLQCHEEKFAEGGDNVHQAALEAGNINAAVCADCHDPHAQPRMLDPGTGVLFPSIRVNIPHTCARCHNAIFEEYEDSVHGATLMAEGNLDVPTCTECHGAHQIDPTDTSVFRLSSIDMCANCHTDLVKMAKYGLSTQVLDTYVSDFHGTTVRLFQKTHPDEPTDKAVCYDCHGVHTIARVDDPERGLEIKQNLLVACQRCHPDATINFPDSWMSHYIATPDRYPLVWFVNLFYLFLIPGLIGGMVLYVASDFIRRRIDRRKGADHS
jgi:predicted CXXCH cytochrome family protein